MTLPLLDLIFGPPDDPGGGGLRPGRRRGADEIGGAARSSPPDVDAALVAQLRNSEPRAVDAIVERYYQPLVGFAESFLHDASAAEDVVQDALVAVWNRRDTLTIRTTLAAYLFTTVRHGSFNVRRSLLARRRLIDAQATEEPASVPVPDVLVEMSERDALVRNAVAALAPRYREVLMLRVGGLTYEVIGEILGLPSATARTRGVRGIAMLRAALEGKI